MDETTKSILESIIVEYPTPTKIPSGDVCTRFFDCIRLSPASLARLAAEATGDLPEHTFDIVIGIAYTGILFAAAVAGGRMVSILTKESNQITGPSVKGKKVLIVDDVIHHGTRVSQARDIVERAGGQVIGYACIIDRSDGKFSSGKLLGGLPVWSAYETAME